MEHYALSLQCSPILNPLSYGSKAYENRKFHLRFNQTTLCFPQLTTNHIVTRSISHTNCTSNNSFSVPNSKNIERSDNNILRGINGVSIVLGCILGMFNLNGKMMNSKFNNAYAIDIDFSKGATFYGGEYSFDSMWNSMNDALESNIKLDNSDPSPDNKKKYALSLRKRGKKKEVEPLLEDLKNEYIKSKKYGDIERSIRLSFMELLLIQGDFKDARNYLDEEIENIVAQETENLAPIRFFPASKKKKLNLKDNISEVLVDIYKKENISHDKQSIADIIFYKAIVHTMLKDKELAAMWWGAFAQTLKH